MEWRGGGGFGLCLIKFAQLFGLINVNSCFWGWGAGAVYIYLYIERERERERVKEKLNIKSAIKSVF
jgi:hypothetical protein